MRLGSVAAAPFVGDQFVSLYVGAERVPTVPGKTVFTFAGVDPGENLSILDGESAASAPNNGGSDITGYNLYANGVLQISGNASPASWNLSEVTVEPGDIIRISAVNAIGEGPLSAPVVSEEV
jgi:hypothetical protein